jgi:hypothetical protein
MIKVISLLELNLRVHFMIKEGPILVDESEIDVMDEISLTRF